MAKYVRSCAFGVLLGSDLGKRAGRIMALFVAGASFLSAPVLAADLVASASSTVVDGISVSQIVAMNFGKLGPTPGGGVVQIDVFGDRTVISGSVDLVGSEFTQTLLEVTGEPGTTFTITRSPPGTVSNGSDTMDLTIIGTNSGSIHASGSSNLGSGGQLTLGPNQPLGLYTGTFTITINYN